MTDQNEQNQKSECCGGKCGDHHDHEHQCGCGAKPAAAEGGCGCSDKPAEAAKKETAEPTPQELKAQLKAAEQKVIEHYDLYVRAMADLENARRRSSEELVKTRKFAIEKFAENLLPVVDSLEKALEATAADKDSAAREGMEATYRQLMHALDVSDMKPIDPKGEAFDPHFHMAITMVPAPEGVKPGMVEHCRPSTASGNGECCSGLRHCSFRYQTSPGGSKDLPGFFLPLNSKQVFLQTCP